MPFEFIKQARNKVLAVFSSVKKFLTRGAWKIRQSLRSPKTRKLQNNEPTWYLKAKQEIGVKEDPIYENSRILEYHAVTTYGGLKDEVPWCASFVCWCLEKTGYESTKSAWAKDYSSYGKKIRKPRVGCICVFRRGARNGHVAFYDSETKKGIRVLGGNQENQVKYSIYKKADLIGYRWPSKA